MKTADLRQVFRIFGKIAKNQSAVKASDFTIAAQTIGLSEQFEYRLALFDDGDRAAL